MFDIEISPLSEAEIAYGLVCGGINPRYSSRENLFQRGNPEDWYDKLFASTDEPDIPYGMNDFDDFLSFLKDSKNLPTNFSISKIELGRNILHRVYERLNSKINNANNFVMSSEPSFIEKLKILLEEKTNDWLSEKI